MAKNYMSEITKMLGVEMKEEFYVKDFNTVYRFTNEGLEYQNDDKKWYRIASCLIEDLIKGECEIEKLPWKPKNGDTYCYVYWKLNLYTKKWELNVSITTYDDNCPPHNLCVDVGNCFRTREEAEATKYEVFKRLTGKEWHEMYGKGGDGNV